MSDATAAASPRPWRCECGPTVNSVIASNGAVVVPHTGYAANAALIVDAVNRVGYLRALVRRLLPYARQTLAVLNEADCDLLREASVAIGEAGR